MKEYMFFLKYIPYILCALIMFLGVIVGYFYYYLVVQKRSVNLIVIQHNGGRLANQLWLFANMAAFSLEKGYNLYNPTFYENAQHFEHFHHNLLLNQNHSFYLPILSSNIIKKIGIFLLYTLSKIVERKDVDHKFILDPIEKEKYFIAKDVVALNNGNYYFFGWGFKNPDGLIKYREQLLEIFKPIKDYRERINCFFSDVEPERLRVAVHIRHGDFKTWLNGTEFYSVDQFNQHMKVINNRYQIYRPLFIITSDEPRNTKEFPNLEVCVHQGNLVEDLYVLASCDMVVGVNSTTYAEWASWYGGVPLYRLSEKINWEKLDQEISSRMQKGMERFINWN